MPSTATPRQRPRLAVLVALLPLALVAGLFGPTGPADAAGSTQTVTVDRVSAPFYGQDLTFRVAASGLDNVLQVYHGTTPLLGAHGTGLDDGRPTPVSIPTEGRFRAGVAYTLRAVVDNGEAEGTRSFTFTPSFIPSRVDLTTTSVVYSSPLQGVLVPTVATTVAAGPGSVAMVRNGARTAADDLRAGGAFALTDLAMLPGTHHGVEVYYEGDENYARNLVGSGRATVDVLVTKIPTTTTSALTAAKVTEGDEVRVLATTASSDPATTADVTGVMEVHAAPAGSGTFTKITETAYPGGRQQVSLSLTEWAEDNPGFWTIRTVNHGNDIAHGSASDTSLQVVEPGTARTPTAAELSLSAATGTVLGAPVTAVATVTSPDGPVTDGSVQFWLNGAVVATERLSSTGTATTGLRAAVAGEQAVSAVYLETATYAWSSATGSLTGLKAATTIAATGPSGPAEPGEIVPVRVAATASTAVPTGVLTVTEGGRTLGHVSLADGSGSFRLPALTAGRHTLTVSYAGDASTTASTVHVLVTMAADPVVKVRSVTSLAAKRLAGRKARLIVRVSATTAVTGIVQIRRGTKVVARDTLAAAADGRLRLVLRKLPRGASRLTVRYLGSDTVAASRSRPVIVRFR